MAVAGQPPIDPAGHAFVLTVLAAVTFLGLALVAVARRGCSSLALDFGLMSACMFAYNMLEVVYALTRQPGWAWLEYAAAAASAIPTLRLFVGFVGEARRLRAWLRAAEVFFGLIALASLVPFVQPSLGHWVGGSVWALCMLAGVVPAFAGAGYLLVRHARASECEERARTRLLGGALLLGVGGVITDLCAMAGGVAPRLAAAGLVAASVLIAALVLRVHAFERVTVLTIATATLLAIVGVLLQLAVVFVAGSRIGLVVVGSTIVMLALAALVRPLLRELTEQRARAAYLTTLGRFAEQMAHDLRNPLAAIRGAAQFLQTEKAEGRSLDPHVAFVDMIVERTERLERVIRDYQRIGRAEPVFAPVDVNQIAERSLDLARKSGISAVAELDPGLPSLSGDRDLLEAALENLIKNALDAMPDGGELCVKTAQAGAGNIVLSVRDGGVGMDARTRDRALEEFFTTKTDGSGLGLPFVARVVATHGGRLALESREGRGTEVRLELPIEQPAST
jgi:signal transduction histidine kinase